MQLHTKLWRIQARKRSITYDKKMSNMFVVKTKFCPLKISTSNLDYQKKRTAAVHRIAPGVRYAANASANQILKK